MNPCTTCFARHACQPQGKEYLAADGVWIKEIALAQAGMIVPQHSHAYGHTSFLAKGSVDVVRTDISECKRYTAPHPIFIPAGVKHSFVTLEDDTLILCIHNVSRTGSVEVREEHHLIPPE